MTNSEPRTDWPFGPFLSAAIQRSGLSKRAIARAARISEGRLRQLETGYQKSGKMQIPIATSVTTVINLSDVLGFDLRQGLRLAGLEHLITEAEGRSAADDEPVRKNPLLATFDTGELFDELKVRFMELARLVGRDDDYAVTVPLPGAHPPAGVIESDDERDARDAIAKRRRERAASNRQPARASQPSDDSLVDPEMDHIEQTAAYRPAEPPGPRDEDQ